MKEVSCKYDMMNFQSHFIRQRYIRGWVVLQLLSCTILFHWSTYIKDKMNSVVSLSYCETQPSSIQRLSSIIFPCSSSSFVVVVVVRPSRMVTSPLYDVLDHINHTFSESSWSKDIKTDISKCLMHKYTNTNTQIHKYSKWLSARKTQHVVYFWKEDCSRISKIIIICAKRTNTKIQIQKYTNTQIQQMTKCQKDPLCSIFLKRGLFKDIKNYIPMCQTRKYKIHTHKYTNT